MDRLSQLPEPILQHILSFLDTKQIVQASTVSKTLLNAWSTFQTLDFDITLFNFRPPPNADADEVNQMRDAKVAQVYDFVDRTLLARREQMTTIKRLKLYVSSDAPVISAAERWVGYAVDCNVEVLNVHGPSPLNYRNLEFKYKLSPIVLAAESISELELVSCKLVLPRGHRVKLTSLKRLFLFEVYADDDLMKTLFAGCPVIEDIRIYHCYGLKHLHLPRDLTKLDQVRIDNNHDLERLTIDASNLHSLVIYGPSLPLDTIHGAACKNLKELLLLGVAITDEVLCEQLLSKFPIMEKLVLVDCWELESIKITSNLLKELTIFQCNDLVEVELNTPYLHTFYYKGDVIPFSPNDMSLSEVSIGLEYEDEVSIPLDAKSIEFMSIFCRRASLLDFSCSNLEDFIVPKEVREAMPSPSYISKELNLGMSPVEGHATVEIVDTLLWISPHVERLSIKGFKKFYFKFSYGRQVNEGGTPCCSSVPVRCWQQCIKSVKIMKFCRVEKKAEYFQFEDDIWRNVEDLLNREMTEALGFTSH